MDPNKGKGEPTTSMRRNRVIAGCVAAVLVAGLGAGLALPLVAPSQEAPVAATTAAATTEGAPAALAASDVAAMLPGLSFDGQDVSIASDLATVGVSETGNVVVTNASTDDAATVVSSTAMRSAALAGELGGAPPWPGRPATWRSRRSRG